jgi:hypothetical protein
VALDAHRVRVSARGVRIDVGLEPGPGAVETASRSGRSWIWTRKRAGVAARGSVELRGRRHELRDALAVVDESAGYHERHTRWRWSAGVARGERGERIGWNLVAGVHDAAEASERSVWVDDEPVELPPAEFGPDLSRVGAGDGGLAFSPWSEREHHLNLGLLRTSYRQPFGVFEGELAGVRIAPGYGVMEDHDVRW